MNFKPKRNIQIVKNIDSKTGNRKTERSWWRVTYVPKKIKWISECEKNKRNGNVKNRSGNTTKLKVICMQNSINFVFNMWDCVCGLSERGWQRHRDMNLCYFCVLCVVSWNWFWLFAFKVQNIFWFWFGLWLHKNGFIIFNAFVKCWRCHYIDKWNAFIFI